MACFSPGTVIDLSTRENLPLRDVRGAMLRVTRGSLWITQENDTQDVVLRAGDTWVVERDGLTIVEAQAESTVCVVGRNVEAVLASRRTAAAPATAFWSRVRNAAESFFVPPPPRALPYF